VVRRAPRGPASSTADLICAEGDRRAVDDRDGVARAPASVIGRRPPSAMLTARGADLRHRIEDTLHRPLAHGRVTVECRRDRAAVDRPHDETAARPRIAEIERGRRLAEPADPTPEISQTPSPTRSTRAPSAAMALLVLMTSSPLELGPRCGSCRPPTPRGSGRWCEIDLSPGTRRRPDKAPLRRAVKRHHLVGQPNCEVTGRTGLMLGAFLVGEAVETSPGEDARGSDKRGSS